MKGKSLINLIFTHPYINKMAWVFEADTNDMDIEFDDDDDDYIGWLDGIWQDGTWVNGFWQDGTWVNGFWQHGQWNDGTWHGGIWEDGIWEDGIWNNGKIWDPKLKKYRVSKVSPKECKWSLSYEG